jgi:hypothetical protein
MILSGGAMSVVVLLLGATRACSSPAMLNDMSIRLLNCLLYLQEQPISVSQPPIAHPWVLRFLIVLSVNDVLHMQLSNDPSQRVGIYKAWHKLWITVVNPPRTQSG